MGASNGNSKKRFIVVIDDSETVCRMLEMVLSGEGHQAVCFLDPAPALRSILITGETPLPDLLVIDLNLPRIDGYAAITRFRNHPASLHIPIIAISRLGDTVSRLKARLAGANAFLEKPFQPQDVLTLVRDVVVLPNSNIHENE